MRKAFTLYESIAVIGIILLLYIIGMSSFAKAKGSAHATNCHQNLRQIAAAVALYRESEGNSAMSGTVFDMGLPPFPLRTSLPITTSMKCGVTPNALFPHPQMFPYLYFPVDPERDRTIPRWQEYTAQKQDEAILVVDMNHNDDQRVFFAEAMAKIGIGVRLNGSIARFAKSGNWKNKMWWH